MPIDLEVVGDEKAAARRAAELIAAAGAAAVADHGSFAFAMSGGRSPWAMLAILGELEEMPWRETELFQVDERIASPGSEDRNLTHMVLGLSMDHQSALRPMPVTTPRPRRGGARIRHLAARPRSTSSTSASAPTATPPRWSPATRSSRSTDRRVAMTTNEYQGHRRMTLTYRPSPRPARSLAGHRRGEAAARSNSSSPPTRRSPPAASATNRCRSSPTRAAAPQ